MNQAVSHIASRRKIWRAVQKEDVYRQNRGGGGSRLFQAEVTYIWGTGGRYQVDSLTSAHQNIPDWLFKIKFLGEAESAVRLGIKSQFGDVGLAQMTPFGACYRFF